MPAVSGPPPWSSWYTNKASRKNKGKFTRLLKGNQTLHSHTAPSEMLHIKDFKHPMRPLRNPLNGNVYYLPKQDFEELVEYFTKHESELSQGYREGKKIRRNVQSPADYIDYAFETKTQQKNIVTQECQGGHIKKLSYNAMYQVLMVEFTNNGSVCVFFNLPANVAETLLYHARNNIMAVGKMGDERHGVGVQFWNLVRVRGTVHNTWYPFQYTKDFSSGEPFGRRQGVGPKGQPSKWLYLDSETAAAYGADIRDKRYKNNADLGENNTTRRESQMRLLREDYQAAIDNARSERKQYTEDQKQDAINYFFEEGLYDKELSREKLTNAQRAALTAAYRGYMNMDNSDNIIDNLEAAGVNVAQEIYAAI